MNITIGLDGQEKPTRNKGKSIIDFPNEYIVIDIETTGLDPSYDEIIEIAALKISNDEIISSFSSLCKPTPYTSSDDGVTTLCYVDEFITKLTGITNEMLSEAPITEIVIKDFIEFIGDSILIGHNVNFDVNFLYDSVKQYYNLDFSNNFIDTMRIARKLLPELKHHRLIDLIKHYGISSTSSHRAMPDVENTYTLFQKLKSGVMDKYETVQEFSALFLKNYKAIDIKSIKPTTESFDDTHPLYNKMCVFTGTLEKMARKDAMQIVVNLGGMCGNSVTLNTNYLILGNLEYTSNIKGDKSNKLKKAEQLKLKGKDIEIISENVFYDLINS